MVDISADTVAILIIVSIVRAIVTAICDAVHVRVLVVVEPRTSVASIAHPVVVTVKLMGVRVLRAVILRVADVVIVGVLELIDATLEQVARV